jgi:hypothetical protein
MAQTEKDWKSLAAQYTQQTNGVLSVRVYNYCKSDWKKVIGDTKLTEGGRREMREKATIGKQKKRDRTEREGGRKREEEGRRGRRREENSAS